MLSVSFDIDGTLVDNARLVRAAYEAAGVVLTDAQWTEVWGKPYAEWLVKHLGGDYEKAWRVHLAKNEHYERLQPSIGWAPLSGLTVARFLADHPNHFEVSFITGSSRVAANFVLSHFKLPQSRVFAGLTPDGKVAKVRELGCIHIDDDDTVVHKMQIADQRCIKYRVSIDPQSLVDMIKEMFR